MLEPLFRLLAEAGPGITWTAICLAALVAVFMFYIGLAMLVTLRAHDPARAKISYQVFRDLLDLFSLRRPR